MRRFVPGFVLLCLFTSCQCGVDRLVTTPKPVCTAEVCNGLDDDCDGEVDDGLPTLDCGVGACAVTIASCRDGKTQTCTPGEPVAETCNGADDDCDGEVDDGLPTLDCGVGACAVTIASCRDGKTQTCTPGEPVAETCNGADDDCDGQVDEDQGTRDCGVGACLVTVPACSELCTPGQPTAETCNQLDDDCDGQIDEGACAGPTVTCPAAKTARLGDSVSFTADAMAGSSPLASTGWTVAMAPAGSTAMPVSASTPGTTFTPDRGGLTTLRFCATDEAGHEACCETSVDTSACQSPPMPPVSTACGTSWDGRPIVQFAPVPSGLTYQLSRAADATVVASASTGSNWLRPAQRIDPGGPIPGRAVQLEVRACRSDDLACCSSPTPLQVAVVETCSTPIAPTSSTLVFSEYVVNGEGMCPSSDCDTHDTCQAGESIELTNLSNCPLALNGFHFAYRNASASSASYRWMNFGAGDVIPPRGVYVAMRNRQYAPTCGAALPAQSAGLYGLKISSLAMNGPNLCNGWFNNSGGGQSELQVAPGTIAGNGPPSFTPANAVARIAPYLSTGMACDSVGFDAVDSCGSVVGGTQPGAALSPNQLGRLWHPCDAVSNPVPACVRD